MKTTETMTSNEVLLRRARRRKRVLRNRILVTLACIAIFGTALYFGINALKRGSEIDLSHSYEQTHQSDLSLYTADVMKAEPFAKELCVSSGNVDNMSVSINSNELAALFDVEHRTVLFAQDMYNRVYPASITKIMTAILALEYGNMVDMVTITEEDVTLEEGSQMAGFLPGDQVSMDMLLHGLLVYSGNDCAMAIARHIGGDVPSFVNMMNSRAAKLGATGTHFVNPHGLHDDDHYTTVYDIYLMLNEALKNAYFVDAMQLGNYLLRFNRLNEEGKTETLETVLYATDHYLTGEKMPPADVTVLGGKTGTTSLAGSCLAIVSQNRYGEPYISVIMKATGKENLYTDMNTLLEQIN